jgi:hypothetical protein
MTTINTAQPSVSVFMISAVLSSSQITKRIRRELKKVASIISSLNLATLV